MASPSSIVNMRNTTAVCLMQQNRHDEAKQAFRACLHELVGTEDVSEVLVQTSHRPTYLPSPLLRRQQRAAPFLSSTGPLMDTTDAMQSDISNGRVKVVYGVSIEHPLCITNTIFLSSSPDNLFNFYNRAFIISSNLAADLPVVYESVIAGVLLYNIGLSSHGKAIRSGSSKELRGTLTLYKMSLRSILQDDSSLHSKGMLHVLLLALLNNIGCIHSHFYDWKEMKECRETLYLLFASANDLTVEDYVFFSYVLLPSSHIPPFPVAA
jgi:hypothetical protein